MNEIMESDILRGEKTIAVELRDGQTVGVDCRALSWAASCKIMSLADPAELTIHAILNGVAAPQANDEFLNRITPLGMLEVAQTVFTLTHGIGALKKAQAARNPGGPPATPISTSPPASCAGTDSAGPKYMNFRRRN